MLKGLMLRLSLGTLVAMIVAVAVGHTIFHHAIFAKLTESLPEPARGGALLVAKVIEDTPPDKQDKRLEELSRSFGYPIKLYPSTELSEDVKDRLTRDRPAFYDDFGDQYVFIKMIDDRVVGLGPVPFLFFLPMWSFVLLFISMILIVIFTGFLLSYPLVSQLSQLEKVIRSYHSGDLTARMRVYERGPINLISERFNELADSHERILNTQNQMLQAVAHELRTPTARIRFGLEMLSVSNDDKEREKRFSDIDDDLMELDELVAELAQYVQLDNQPPSHALREIDVEVSLERVVERLPVTNSSLSLRVDVEEGLRVMGEPKLFDRALRNLLTNALRHAKSAVTVFARCAGDAVEISVEDDGAGVPEEARTRVFEPFARLDNSRNRASGGLGLGLAIVQRIVEAHGAKARVEEAVGGGARFVVRWPAPKVS